LYIYIKTLKYVYFSTLYFGILSYICVHLLLFCNVCREKDEYLDDKASM
jgi:hypothetical protein